MPGPGETDPHGGDSSGGDAVAREGSLQPCRDCGHRVSGRALACPHCGAPRPALPMWDGWGYEYRSKATLLGVPLLHVSFKYSPDRRPVVARGIVAIGQFACGFVTIAQFGVGVVCVGQFALGVLALAQFGAALSLVAQMGLYVVEGHGQIVRSVAALLGLR